MIKFILVCVFMRELILAVFSIKEAAKSKKMVHHVIITWIVLCSVAIMIAIVQHSAWVW